MTKNSFKFLYTLWMKILMVFLLVLFTVALAKNLLTIFGAFGWTSVSLTLDVAGSVLSTFFITVIVFMLVCSNYRVANFSLQIKTGLFLFKIPCGLISNIVKIENDDTLFILYVNAKAKPSQMKINIEKGDQETFVTAIKSFNPDVVYESYRIDSTKK